LQLRPYQVRDVEAIRAAFRTDSQAPLYVAPTGSGKTVLFGFIAKEASRRGSRVWIIVHRRELVYQTSRTLSAFEVEHGVVAPGFTPYPMATIQVCSKDTLRVRMAKGLLGDVDLLVFDEGHHATAGTWRMVRDARPDAKVLGVTATPVRLDGKGLGLHCGGVYDALVLGPSIADLITEGWLCRPVSYAPPSKVDLTGVKVQGGDYVASQLGERMDTPTITGDAVQHYQTICPGAPALAFCATVEHAEHVAADFRTAGYRFESIDGTMNNAQRARRIAGLGDGTLHGLTSCDIVSDPAAADDVDRAVPAAGWAGAPSGLPRWIPW
jgi:superfamily II DNA or RNA helicase